MKRILLVLGVLFLTNISGVGAEENESGNKIFQQQCSYCHAPGLNRPGTLQLTLTRGEEFGVLEEREDLTADYVKYIVRHGLNAMPSFKPSEITHKELDALADYLSKGG